MLSQEVSRWIMLIRETFLPNVNHWEASIIYRRQVTRLSQSSSSSLIGEQISYNIYLKEPQKALIGDTCEGVRPGPFWRLLAILGRWHPNPESYCRCSQRGRPLLCSLYCLLKWPAVLQRRTEKMFALTSGPALGFRMFRHRLLSLV